MDIRYETKDAKAVYVYLWIYFSVPQTHILWNRPIFMSSFFFLVKQEMSSLVKATENKWLFILHNV